MLNKTTFRPTGTHTIRRSLLALAGLTSIHFAAAQDVAKTEDLGELEELVISATKFPTPKSETTAQVKVLDLDKLKERGIYDVRSALNESPGVLSLSTAGEAGSTGALLLRGTATADSQVIVDGMRINDSNGSIAGNFLRAPQVNSFGRVELLRGPQGSLYGGNALGGVLFMETPTGRGEAETTLFGEVGEFETLNTFFSNSGSKDAFSWFVGGGYNGTHNDTSGQDFDQSNYNQRFEFQVNEDVVIGTTLRLIDQRFKNNLTTTNHLDETLGTVYVRANLAEDWKASFVLGHYRQNYDSVSATNTNYSDLDRTSISMDHSIALTEKHGIRFGGYLDTNDFTAYSASPTSVFTDVGGHEIRYGGYVGYDWQPLENLITKATLRWEDYAKYGEEVTWNVGRAYTPPTFLDLYGSTATSSVGNPNLEAQESIGWDIGMEQEFLEDHIASVAYFHNHLDNTINRPFGKAPSNLTGDTETNGIEVGLNGSFSDSLISYSLAWTYIGKSVNFQPDYYATGSVELQATERLALGVGATYLAERKFSSFANETNSAIIPRVYARYALTDSVMLHARVENVTDEQYELIRFNNPTNAPGFAFYTGLTATF